MGKHDKPEVNEESGEDTDVAANGDADEPTTYATAVGEVEPVDAEPAAGSDDAARSADPTAGAADPAVGATEPTTAGATEPIAEDIVDPAAEDIDPDTVVVGPDTVVVDPVAEDIDPAPDTVVVDPAAEGIVVSDPVTDDDTVVTEPGAKGPVVPGPAAPGPVAEDPAESAPVLPRRRVSKLLVAGRVLVGLVSAVALAAMALVYLRVGELDDSKNTTDAVAEAQSGPNAPVIEAEDDGAKDILIVGNDSRTDMQGRQLSAKVLRELRTEATETTNTDTLILLRIPHDGGKASAISIPRDTSVRVTERNRDEKINGVFGITKALAMERMVGAGEKDRAKINRDSDDEGRRSLIQAVQGLTGARVDHYVEVSLYGFYLLTQAIDGVDVCLNHSTSDPDSGASFRKGPQTVRGGDAVAFVRQRKNLPRGDLDRIVRQQVFLSSAMQKVLSGDLLTNNAKLNSLEEAVSKTMIMDAGLHFLDLVTLAQTMASGNVSFVTIPVEAVGARNDRQQSIVVVDVPKVQAFVKGLLTPAPQPAGLGAAEYGGTAPAAAVAVAVAQPVIPCVD